MKCRLCEKAQESVMHVLPGCSALVQTKYLLRHDATTTCDHAICSEYDNFPTCCCPEYLAFLDDPEEPVHKGVILIANISTFDIIIRNITAYNVLKRAHQSLPSASSYNSSVHRPFHFILSKIKLKGGKRGKHFVTDDFPQSCNNDLVLLAARHMARTREHLTSITAIP